MIRKTFHTDKGNICYWLNQIIPERMTLVFLPGLTADHHLFDDQIPAFEHGFNVFVWDAPGHACSRPFELSFSLKDKADWLHAILEKEGIRKPVLIGQSMGGYLSQSFMQQYPHEAAGFVSIDSAPLKRMYTSSLDIWLLKRTEPMYRMFPWKILKKETARACSVSEKGRSQMMQMMDCYTWREYCALAGHGFRIVAEAIEEDLAYEINCPSVLICGQKDRTGYVKRYNRNWSRKENLPVEWIQEAGHNSNTDRPEEINRIIHDFIGKLKM